MLLDLLSSDNNLSVNIKVMNTLGLQIAVYISGLLALMHKNAYQDGSNYFLLNRADLTQLTTLNIEEQVVIEKKLISINLFEYQEDLATLDTIHVKFDLNNYLNLICNGDAKLLDKVSKLSQIKAGEVTKTGRISARQRQALNLKYSVKAPNQELLDAYKNWIDGVYSNPAGFLSVTAITAFQKSVDAFAQNDLDLALKIIEIATINGYRVAEWAINVFKKDYEAEWRKTHAPVRTNVEARKATIQVGEVF